MRSGVLRHLQTGGTDMALGKLHILHIVTNVHALVTLNGSIAGETHEGALTVSVPVGKLAVQVQPLEDAALLPITRLLEVGEDTAALSGGGTGMRLFVLPGQALLVRVDFPQLRAPCMPYVLQTLNFSAGTRGLHASVYLDGVFGLCIEENGAIVFAAPFAQELSAARLMPRRLDGKPVLIAEGSIQAGKEVMLVLLEGTPRLLRCEICDACETDEAGVFLVQTLPGGCLLRSACRADGTLSSALEVQGEPDNPGLRLIQCVRYGAAQQALDVLAPGLRASVAFEDLREFFGEFSGLCDCPVQPGEVALEYPVAPGVCGVRVFRFAMEGGRVSNIEET